MEQKVKSTLDAVSYVCTTADRWTAHDKSFFWHDGTLDQSIAATTLLAKLLLPSQTMDQILSRPVRHFV